MNAKTEHTVFVTYMGHVRWVEAYFYYGGWKGGDRDAIYLHDDIRIDLDHEDASDKLLKVSEYLSLLLEGKGLPENVVKGIWA